MERVQMTGVPVEAAKARFTWGIRSGKELEGISPEYTWVRDVSLVEGMKVIARISFVWVDTCGEKYFQ